MKAIVSIGVMPDVKRFGLVPCDRVIDSSRYGDICDGKPGIISGLEEIDVLCPVDPLTGHRDSFENIVKKALDPKYAGLASRVLQELPSVQMDNDPKNDEAKLDTLVSRLDTGSLFERDAVIEQLSSISDVLFRSAGNQPNGEPTSSVSEPVSSVDVTPE